MYNYQQQEAIPIGIPIATGYPMIQEEFKANYHYPMMQPAYNYSQGFPLQQNQHYVSVNSDLLAQPQQPPMTYPTFENNSNTQPKPYVSKFQKLAQMLNEDQPAVFGPGNQKSASTTKKIPKDPKDMTEADRLQEKIEQQNELAKAQQQKMLNFIQPKTVKVYSNKPSIEEQIPVIQNAVSCATPLNSNYVIHKVSPNETLDRICLIYNCPKDAIRKANGFSGDEIYMKKELIIPSSNVPVSRVDPNLQVNEDQRRKDMIDLMNQHLREKYGYKSSFKAEAQYYLEIAGYDFLKAIKEFEEDYKFEKEQEEKFKGNKGKKMAPLLYVKK